MATREKSRPCKLRSDLSRHVYGNLPINAGPASEFDVQIDCKISSSSLESGAIANVDFALNLHASVIAICMVPLRACR